MLFCNSIQTTPPGKDTPYYWRSKVIYSCSHGEYMKDQLEFVLSQLDEILSIDNIGVVSVMLKEKE